MTKDLPIYKITIDPDYSDGEDLGIEQIAFTSQPAIKVKGMAFNQAERMVFADDLKYRITAPAMIPMEIYRKDDEQGEYYVQFSEDTIAKIHEKFMSDFCIVDDSDYFFQSEIEEGIRNPAEVWTKITSYEGEVKFDNMLFMDYVLDKIDANSKK